MSKQLLLVLILITSISISWTPNNPKQAKNIKGYSNAEFAKKKSPGLIVDTSGCILFPKSAKFLRVLKKASCVSLPFDVNYDNQIKKGVKFTFSDSLFLDNALKNSKLKIINRVAVLDGGSPDDFSGIGEKEHKYLPLNILYDTKRFVIVSIKNQPRYGPPSSLICSFTSNGVFIDGFVANYGMGNGLWNVNRVCVIDKNHVIKLTETGQGNQSDDDNYDFSAVLRISNNGCFKRITQNVKYGNGYTNDDDRFTKIK